MNEHVYLTFPEHLVAIPKYDGYVWNLNEEKLYSFKRGNLREMRKYFGKCHSLPFYLKGKEYYVISHEGTQRYLFVKKLKKIKPEKKVINTLH